MYDVVCSLVVYKNENSQLLMAIESFLNTKLLVKLIIVDHSPTNALKNIKLDSRIEYVHNPSNPGFGSGHNFAIKKYNQDTKYFLILNPDIFYGKGVLEGITTFMDNNQSVGLVMPKVVYPDGSTQYLAKLIPSPFDFFIRRFFFRSPYMNKLKEKFEMRKSGYNKVMDVPYLSGCFMVFKAEVLMKLNGFDEKIFMHMEDLDISRRCTKAGFRNVFYPHESVVHDHLYKSITTVSNLKMYLGSAIYYFNKWGWFFDKERIQINRKALEQFEL